jgi:hypothetical protein
VTMTRAEPGRMIAPLSQFPELPPQALTESVVSMHLAVARAHLAKKGEA